MDKRADAGGGSPRRLGRVRLAGFLAIVAAGFGLDLFGVFGEDKSFSSAWRRPLASGRHAVDDAAGFGFSHGTELQLIARGGLAGFTPAEVAVALLDAGLASSECQKDSSPGSAGRWGDPAGPDARVCGDAVAVLGCADDRVMVACPISCRRCHGDKRVYAASASVTPASANITSHNTASQPPPREPLPPLSSEVSLQLLSAGLSAAECPEGRGADPATPVRDPRRRVPCCVVVPGSSEISSPRLVCCRMT